MIISAKGAFTKKKHQRLAIEKGAEWLKWVLVTGLGPSAVITEMGIFALSDPAAIEKLSLISKKYKIQPEEVFTCLPRTEVTARNIELPSTNSEEIKKIVDLQAVKQTPYAADEIVFDYYLLRVFREGYSNVMLVIAHREVLNVHLKLLADVGLPSPWITLTTESSASWVVSQLNFDMPPPMVAVLDVDADYTDFYICQGESVFFSQNLSVGAQRLETDAAAAGEKLIEELGRSMQIYRSEEVSSEPVFLVLTGAYARLLPLSDAISSATSLTLKEVPLPEKILTTLAEKSNSADWSQKLSFSAVLGLGFREKTPPLNLVPQEVVITATFVEKSRNLFIAAVLLLAIFLTGIAEFGVHFYRRQSYLRMLEQKSADAEKGTQEVSFKRTRIKEIVSRHEASLRFFDEITHVARSVPNEIYVTEMNLATDNRFFLQGRADSMTSVFDFVNKLKTNPDFQNVETKKLNKRIVDNREVVDFEVETKVAFRTGVIYQ